MKIEWIDWCENKNSCIESDYYNKSDSCLYTGKPCSKFRCSVPLQAIRRVYEYISQFNTRSFDVVVKNSKIYVYAEIGLYEKLSAVFNKDGELIDEIIYD